MTERPAFEELSSYKEFQKYYWYRAEFVEICKSIGVDHTGVKTELSHNIAEYFKGNRIKKVSRSVSSVSSDTITLDTPLLGCKFSFNAKFRVYFSSLTGIVPFKFTATMATAWRRVKAVQDTAFTIRDLLKVYEGDYAYETYDASACEWNQFLKDFCADEGISPNYKPRLLSGISYARLINRKFILRPWCRRIWRYWRNLLPRSLYKEDLH